MKYPIFDAHCDTAIELYLRQLPLRNNQTLAVSLEEAACLPGYAQIFAFCTYGGMPLPGTPSHIFAAALGNFQRELAQNTRYAALCDPNAAAAAIQAGKTAVLLSLEGPEGIDCDWGRLEELQAQGFCMTTLTWNADNKLAGYHGGDRGLTPAGRDFVRAAQRLGITVDVSHCSERTFWDIMEISEKPVVASHSNSAALCPHSRNLTDEQYRALCQSGGGAGLNLYVPFLGGDCLEQVLRHAAHFMALCGPGHVFLGGDLDGCDQLPKGFSRLSHYAALTDALEQAFGPAITGEICFRSLQRILC